MTTGEAAAELEGPARPAAVPVDDFDSCFAEQRDRLVRLAALVLGGTAGAEDVVHDVFVRAWGRWNRITDPPAYLRAAVVNACRGELRHRRLLPRLHRLAVSPTDAVPAPDHVLDAVGRLPPRQRCAIVLRYHLQLSDAEVGAALGCRPGAANELIRRGLATLRRAMADEAAEGRP